MSDFNINKIFIVLSKFSLIPIIISGMLVFITSGSYLVPEHPSAIPSNMSLTELIITTLYSIILSGVVVLFMYLFLLKNKKSEHLIIAAIMSPIIFITTVFFGNTLLLILFKGATPNPFLYLIIAFLSIYLTALSFIFILTDMLPNSLRNIFVIGYSSIFGTFLGLSLPTISMVFILLVLVFEDLLMISKKPHVHRKNTSYDPYSYIRFAHDNFLIGAGDFIVYSIISSHTMLIFGLFVWILVFILLLAGLRLSLVFLSEEKTYVPVLPIPVTLSIIVWLILIIT